MEISVQRYLLHHYPMFEKFPTGIRNTIVKAIKRLFHEEEINDFLLKNQHKDTYSFIESILDYFHVTTGLTKQELDYIPSYGRVVVIANHPLGALDALSLLHLLRDVRKDVKIVANSFLSHFEPLKDILIPVDNIHGKMDKESLKSIYEALKKEQAVIIFPSGEVSRARPTGIKDTNWKSGFLKIASKMHAPLLPVFIDAKNSRNFYLLSMLNRTLATATLPHEMFKSQHKHIDFTIGKPIPYESYQQGNLSPKESVKLLRKHFYRVAKGGKEIFKTHNEISMPESRSELKNELKKGVLLGDTFDGKRIILYESSVENVVLKEIGRLREVSFRFVGEGSGRKRDIDSFDLYYKHLVIWDDEALEIAGAYRIGLCKDILDNFDVDGLYTSRLFEYSDSFDIYFEQGIELGRSFVQPKYWNTRALDYLWQGIGALVRQKPQIRYLFGAVSISDAFSLQAKSMMIYFYQHYFGTTNTLVKHKFPYQMPASMKQYCEDIFVKNNYKTDIKILKDELALRGFAIPTLYKQYSEVCDDGGVVFYDFGYDSEFNNCVDGFICVDLHMLKSSKRERYIGVSCVAKM